MLRFAHRDALEKLSAVVLHASVAFLDSSAPCSGTFRARCRRIFSIVCMVFFVVTAIRTFWFEILHLKSDALFLCPEFYGLVAFS